MPGKKADDDRKEVNEKEAVSRSSSLVHNGDNKAKIVNETEFDYNDLEEVHETETNIVMKVEVENINPRTDVVRDDHW